MKREMNNRRRPTIGNVSSILQDINAFILAFHYFNDTFRYSAYVMQATGDDEEAELVLQRTKTLDPRTGE